jgi:hypothetical protein
MAIPDSLPGWLSPTDIARLAHRTPAAVSNWQRRNRDFPNPVAGTKARPLFARAEVLDWLGQRPNVDATDLGDIALIGIYNQFLADWSIEDMASLVFSTLCAHKLLQEDTESGPTWDSVRAEAVERGVDALRRAATRLQEHDDRWLDLVWVPDTWRGDKTHREGFALIAEVVDSIWPRGVSAVGDAILERVAAEQARAGGDHGLVGSRVSQVLAAAAAKTSGVVYDPACGIGQAVINVWAQTNKAATVVGHEIDQAAARVAKQRCYLRGIPASIRTADVLLDDPDPTLKADAVVVEPPFGMSWSTQRSLADPRWKYGVAPTASSELAWVQHAIAHLAPEGRAYVITSMSSLFGHFTADIRSGLLRDGCIDAIVGLRGKMLPHTSIPLALWVLRPGGAESSDPVLIVDASEHENPELDITGWLRLGEHPPGNAPPFVRVAVDELLAHDADLTPRRWTMTPRVDQKKIVENYQIARISLRDGLTALAEHTAPATIALPEHPPRVFTVKQLIQEGVATLLSNRVARSDFPEDNRLVNEQHLWKMRNHMIHFGHRPALPDRGEMPSVAWADEADDTVLLGADGVVVTQPGDILVTTRRHGEVLAIVDESGGYIPVAPVEILRVDPTQLIPRYVAHCLAGQWNKRFMRGTTLRADIRDLEVPLVSLADQQAVSAALEHTRAVSVKAREVAASAAMVIDSWLDVIRFGVPADDQRPALEPPGQNHG